MAFKFKKDCPKYFSIMYINQALTSEEELNPRTSTFAPLHPRVL